MEVLRLAAFAVGSVGGNPAGVVLCDRLPLPLEMQVVAAKIGYSETVFAAPEDGGWRVRYFAPAMEIPFCGHATIALGAALAAEYGKGVYALRLNDGAITVEGDCTGDQMAASLQSPSTRSEAAGSDAITTALSLFSYDASDLDPALPPAFIEAGARHFMLALSSRSQLSAMHYNFEAGAELMTRWGLATIILVNAETPSLFHARNAFAAGGVYEDAATGAAAAALAGYLRDIRWSHEEHIEIRQGDDMGTPCRLLAQIPAAPGSSIRVSGAARYI